ncbi:MAG: hypothetical protein ACYCX2_02095 [Christensenellales bacterium]
MPDYETMYFQLASKVADAIELLVYAQQLSEKQLVEKDESFKLILLSKAQNDKNKAEE